MVFSGYLTKRGSVVPNWKRRYFELSVNTLTYYEYEGGTRKGSIHITSTTLIKETHFMLISHAFYIENIDDNTVLYLSADTESDKNLWISALMKTIERLKSPRTSSMDNTAVESANTEASASSEVKDVNTEG
mmetsp:Transcript_3979/g.6212  ORF Transcript_3979/g.6212 Transcript_3979/m.6212 type:complete len:132 (-) Transcript_3979:135-530(-)